MKSTRRRREAVLATLVAGAAVVLVVGAGVLYFGSTVIPVHTTPAAIPSAAADVDAGRYVPAVDEARRLARALLVEDNLPGLSVAVAVDGAIVWTEGFGYAAVDRTPVTPLTRFRLGALSKPMTSVRPPFCTIGGASISMCRFSAMCQRIRKSHGRSPLAS